VAEYSIADAVSAVSMKSRSAAVADTYANQGTRAGAILPFTSALAGLSAAASAGAFNSNDFTVVIIASILLLFSSYLLAAVELLPFVHSYPILQCGISLAFPLSAALFGAAASVSKARCEVCVIFTCPPVDYLSVDNYCCRLILPHQIKRSRCWRIHLNQEKVEIPYLTLAHLFESVSVRHTQLLSFVSNN